MWKSPFRLFITGSLVLATMLTQPTAGHAAGHSRGLAWFRPYAGEVVIWQLSDARGTVSGTRTVTERCDQACVNTSNVVGMGDLNRDGVSDVVWHNYVSGEVRAWLLDISGTVTGMLVLDWTCNATCYERWKPVGLGDINHDGFTDLLWYDRVDGIVSAWLLTGSRVVLGRMDLNWPCDEASGCALDWRPIAVGDLNSDGHDDVVWHNRSSGAVSGWILDGTRWPAGTLQLDWPCAEVCSGEWDPIGLGDLNGDGAQDLWWHNHHTGLVAAWLLNGSDVVAGQMFLSELCADHASQPVPYCSHLQMPIGISE